MKPYEKFHHQEFAALARFIAAAGLIFRTLVSAVRTQTTTIRQLMPNRLRVLQPLSVTCLALAGAGLGATPALAAATLGSILTVSNAPETQDLPAIAWHPGCNVFLVVWQDRRNGVDDDIWGRYVSGTGEALSSGEFNLTPGQAGNQRAPAITYHDGHDFLVVWMDDQAGNWDIYGQYFDCRKTSTTALISISTTPEPQQFPDVAARYGEAWVVWQDQRSGNWDIYGQRVTFPLPPVDPNVFISNQVNDQSYPAIAANPNDTGCTLESFLVTWRDSRNSATTGPDIYDQQLSDVGRCGPNQVAYREVRSQSFPDIDFNTTDNRYLVVWQDDRAGTTAFDIYGRRILPNGLPDGDAFAISTAGRNQLLPATVYNGGANEFLVVWQDFRNGVSWDIGAQRASGVGALLGANFPITATAGDEINPAVAYGATAGHYVVVWSQGGNIFARAYWP